MRPDQIVRTLLFKDREAGYFKVDELPSKPGEYRYMPYRSAGHYELIEALRSGEPQRCHYLSDGQKRFFLVLRWVKYGVPELGNFDVSA
jgi:hypothetical protein